MPIVHRATPYCSCVHSFVYPPTGRANAFVTTTCTIVSPPPPSPPPLPVSLVTLVRCFCRLFSSRGCSHASWSFRETRISGGRAPSASFGTRYLAAGTTDRSPRLLISCNDRAQRSQNAPMYVYNTRGCGRASRFRVCDANIARNGGTRIT